MAVNLKCQETGFSDTPKNRNATYPRNLNTLQTYIPKILCLGFISAPDLAQNWGSSLSLKDIQASKIITNLSSDFLKWSLDKKLNLNQVWTKRCYLTTKLNITCNAHAHFRCGEQYRMIENPLILQFLRRYSVR